MTSPRLRTVAKLLLAAVVIGAVLAAAGSSIAPNVPVARWVFWCALGLAAFILVSFLRALLELQLFQWVLRKGGGTWLDRWFLADSLRRGEANGAGERSTQDRSEKAHGS